MTFRDLKALDEHRQPVAFALLLFAALCGVVIAAYAHICSEIYQRSDERWDRSTMIEWSNKLRDQNPELRVPSPTMIAEREQNLPDWAEIDCSECGGSGRVTYDGKTHGLPAGVYPCPFCFGGGVLLIDPTSPEPGPEAIE